MTPLPTTAQRARIGVLVSGNGSNLQALIDARRDGRLRADIALVLSNKASAYALTRAARADIESVCIPHQQYVTREAFDARVVDELQQRQIQWVVFAGFMRLVTPVLLDAFQDRILNLHPSLLPAFPGTDAIAQALAYGVHITGCTVHLVTRDMDAGPIVGQRAVAVTPNDTLESLSARIHAAEHELLVDSVRAAVSGQLTITTDGARKRVRVRQT